MKAEQAYKEILDVLKKHKDVCIYDVSELDSLAKKHLFAIELREKFGLNIELHDITSLDYNRLGEHVSIGMWGTKHDRKISWSDDGKQPENELLLVISFPCGAYIFGNSSANDYPTELFNEFFEELKTYNPKYTDGHNHTLYFSTENASKIFNEFQRILRKYHELNTIDAKKRKIKRLQEEIAKIECTTENNKGASNEP